VPWSFRFSKQVSYKHWNWMKITFYFTSSGFNKTEVIFCVDVIGWKKYYSPFWEKFCLCHWKWLYLSFFKSAGFEDFYQTMKSWLPRTIPGRKKLCGYSINARIRTMDILSIPKNYSWGQTKKSIMTSLSPIVELQMPTDFWHFFRNGMPIIFLPHQAINVFAT
jgi:hypothetical protein